MEPMDFDIERTETPPEWTVMMREILNNKDNYPLTEEELRQKLFDVLDSYDTNYKLCRVLEERLKKYEPPVKSKPYNGMYVLR